MAAYEKAPGIATNIIVRPLTERDLPVADHVMRLAFGTFLGLPDPTAFMGDAGYVRTRWLASFWCEKSLGALGSVYCQTLT